MAIQVKTNQRGVAEWILNQKVGADFGEAPTYDVISRREVARLAEEGHEAGLATPRCGRKLHSTNSPIRMLELESRFDVHALLKEHRVPLRYTASDLEDDMRVHRELGIVSNDDRRS